MALALMPAESVEPVVAVTAPSWIFASRGSVFPRRTDSTKLRATDPQPRRQFESKEFSTSRQASEVNRRFSFRQLPKIGGRLRNPPPKKRNPPEAKPGGFRHARAMIETWALAKSLPEGRGPGCGFNPAIQARICAAC